MGFSTLLISTEFGVSGSRLSLQAGEGLGLGFRVSRFSYVQDRARFLGAFSTKA